MIADRAHKIDSSGIRKVFDLAVNMENPINLSIGQPDFDIPDSIKQVAIDAIKSGFNSYTPTQGTEELRDSVRGYLENNNRLKNHEDNSIMITSGVSGGLLLAIMSMINPGDEVIFADPYFVMYKHLVNMHHGVSVYVDTYPDFKLTAEKIEPYVSKKTKMLIVNSPSNPTGAVYSKDELKDIATLCNEKNIIVLTDEIYSSFCYDEPFQSIFPYLENGLLLDGFSKSHGMTGWRVGYAVGSEKVIQTMSKIQQYTFVCAPSIVQKAAVYALEHKMSEKVDAYCRKRDLIYNGLKDKFELEKPGGAFYAFVRAPKNNATAFVKKAIANNLLIIPGSVFSEKDSHFRISYAADDEVIKRGIAVLLSI